VNSSKTVAIGDIHGNHEKLIVMYDKLVSLGFAPDSDLLVQVGDLVDGGEKSKEVVEWAIEHKQRYPHWQFLMGNHEDMLVSGVGYAQTRCFPEYSGSFQNWYYQGGFETTQSYDPNATLYDTPHQVRSMIDPGHLKWLSDRPLYHETDDFIFVHAGFYPGRAPAENSDFDMLWIRHSFIDSIYDWGKKVIYGHTYNAVPVVQPNKIGLDTMTHSRGLLTAVILDGPDTFEFIQV
jgi:serine/threonine protein phosphatase 1